jgi:hypothetical protein
MFLLILCPTHYEDLFQGIGLMEGRVKESVAIVTIGVRKRDGG